MNHRIIRQPKAVSICPPSQGAIIGATTMTIVTVAIWLAASSRLAVSRMIARESAKTDPEPAPSRMRASSSISIDGASAPNTEPAMKSAMPALTQGRRPKRSERGPLTSWVSATATRKKVSASWIVA